MMRTDQLSIYIRVYLAGSSFVIVVSLLLGSQLKKCVILLSLFTISRCSSEEVLVTYASFLEN